MIFGAIEAGGTILFIILILIFLSKKIRRQHYINEHSIS